eukprot:TRINITY_DN6583_c0_g1_i1.p1 TRINITY_DN6583_c0_g1~~TRINITY_DN6583_c0_g1_i1.p1  ORF type:complete len:314 (+),score=44.77 TRINITY_DN6583_c0_g1_i1:72-944(+)
MEGSPPAQTPSPVAPSTRPVSQRMYEEQRSDTPPGGSLANPFESTFHLLRNLRDEIQDLKTELYELRTAKISRFEKLEERFEEFRETTNARFQSLETALEKLRSDTNDGFANTSCTLEDMRTTKRLRFDRLEAALKDEVSDRFTAIQMLDKKVRVETAQLRAHCEATSIELSSHKQKAESDLNFDRQNHLSLRQDVDRTAALLAENSMARDPFRDLGYANPSSSPTNQATSQVCTSRGGGSSALAALASAPGKVTLPRVTPEPPADSAAPRYGRGSPPPTRVSPNSPSAK